MMKVLVATEKPFAKAAITQIKTIIEDNGYELVLLEKYPAKEQLLEAVKDVSALIIRSDKIDKAVFDAAPELKIVVRAGAGYDNVDLEEATKHGVVVMNTPGQNSNAVAELVFGLLVYCVRNHFNGTSGTELKGKTLGLLAFGNVPQNVARIAKGFGMNIIAYDAYCPACVFVEHGVKQMRSKEELFKEADIVSLHIPATPETIGSINKDILSLMKDNSILINTARQEVINEVDLVGVLKERKGVKFITDIAFKDKLLITEDISQQYFATPKKMGAQTAEANVNAGIAAANQIVAFFKNGVKKFQVNK